jgi:hypothetical protein
MRLVAGREEGIVEAKFCVGSVMQRLEALQLLEAKLAIIEQDREAELTQNGGLREEADARAEARALGAVFDFLENCKIVPTDSLLRLFKRYLRGAKAEMQSAERRRMPRSRAS